MRFRKISFWFTVARAFRTASFTVHVACLPCLLASRFSLLASLPCLFVPSNWYSTEASPLETLTERRLEGPRTRLDKSWSIRCSTTLFLRSRSHFSYDTNFFSYDFLGKYGFSIIDTRIDRSSIFVSSANPLEAVINSEFLSVGPHHHHDPLLALHGRTLQPTGCSFIANAC